jgi:hypothetical protein
MKRAPFHPSGPFTFRRAATIGGVEFAAGQTVGRDAFPALNDRKVEMLYDAKWFDVGGTLPGAGDTPGPSQDAVEPDPTAGSEGGEGANVPASDQQLAPAPEAAPAETGEGVTPVDPDNGPVAAPEAATAADPAPGAVAAPAPVLAAYKAFGFGRYFAIDAAGEKFGDQLTKSQAEGLSARDRVPLLGQAETLKG